MTGYLAFPPSTTTRIPPQQLNTGYDGACTTCVDNLIDSHNATQAMEDAKQRRREHERVLGERSEIEWVRAGGVLRNASGRRDMVRTQQIRLELNLREVERQRVARWEAYEARWRAMQSSTTPITFVEFPWPLGERVPCRDLSSLTRRAVSEFLFESLEVRSNTTTKRDRIRAALLRWHPDKTAFVLSRVVPEDVELVREGIHVLFGILKILQDTERTSVL